MRDFRRQYLTGKRAVKSGDSICLKKYSHVFVGSDQVWNPEITVGLDDAYIGNVKEKGDCKLIAYGASFGGDALPAKYVNEFRESVSKNFASVSLREKSAVPFMESFFHNNVTNVLDPTLLLKREKWDKIGKRPGEKGYILFVYAEYNKQMVQYLYDLSVELQRKVIQINMPWVSQKIEWIDLRIEAGPAEYIGFFQNADYVITNSFHGMAFSILMEKQFMVFGHSNKNARIKDLMEKLNLMPRLAEYGEMPGKGKMLEEIDWEQVRMRLKQARWHSAGFIRDELN